VKVDLLLRDVIVLHWNLSKERITLGGALMLRAECEMISKQNRQSSFNILVTPGTNSNKDIELIFETVFKSSALFFNLIEAAEKESLYPDAYLTGEDRLFSYSSERIASLSKTLKLAPKLSWSRDVYSEVDKVLETLDEEFICLSLKFSGLGILDGDADIDMWNEVVRIITIELGMFVVVVGNDFIEADFSQSPRVRFLGREGIKLATQLALSEKAVLYVGMASGMASAVTFSETPYLIYKHPEYHSDLMNRELGVSDSFPWANQQQNILRKIPNTSDVIELIKRRLHK